MINFSNEFIKKQSSGGPIYKFDENNDYIVNNAGKIRDTVEKYHMLAHWAPWQAQGNGYA